MNDEEVDNQTKWAHIFNEIGHEQAREILFYATNEMVLHDEDRVVVEFTETKNGNKCALPITGYVEELEDDANIDIDNPSGDAPKIIRGDN